MITQAELQALLDYDPVTGLFSWRVATATHVTVGDIAGSQSEAGYVTIRINGVLHYAHRLAWLYMHGVWVEFIDHDDNIRSNNRIGNLRPTDRTGNNRNVGMKRSNKSGFKGVSWNEPRKVWQAHIVSDRKQTYLGSFTCRVEAANAYDEAAQRLHGAFAKTNKALGLLP